MGCRDAQRNVKNMKNMKKYSQNIYANTSF